LSTLGIVTLVGWLGVVAAALVFRGRQFATFAGVFTGVYSLIALGVAPAFAAPPAVAAAFLGLHALVYVNFAGLARPQMRGFAYRVVVSWPASFFAAGTLLALPWALALAFGLGRWAALTAWFPYLLAGAGLVQSLAAKREHLHLVVGDPPAPGPAPHPHGEHRAERPLRIVQITDPHLGPFMSVARLRGFAERAVAEDPDLVLLTGDFLTMESQSDPRLLSEALAPLRALEGRVFACRGNHDHEAPETVARALAECGVRLLIDESVTVETPAGPVQIVGIDFTFRDRAAHLARVCAAHPRRDGHLRVVLLHDPGAFRHLPEGHGDLVLSGHTHGGQVGLLSLGLQWTFLRLFGLRIPDHGYWARGRDRMYVHRGTGHYGFPLRLGVPAEESVLHVHRVE
jgi:predicted MPP superfamily phosphohydrolase